MTERLSRDWWIAAVQGVAAIVHGILALVWPGITLLALVFLFGALAIVSGMTLLFLAFRLRSHGRGDGTAVAYPPST